MQLLRHYEPQKLCMDANQDDIIQRSKCGRLDQKICEHAGVAGGLITWFTCNDNRYLDPFYSGLIDLFEHSSKLKDAVTRGNHNN